MSRRAAWWAGAGAVCVGALALIWTGAPMANPPAPPEVAAASGVSQPPELGLVRWERDFEVARARAAREQKPLLVLFDEVPGCHTVLGYAREVLSHPLVVEAAEALFVPVVVYNNVDGEDARTLARFKEPAWNNPVVRIIDVDEAPLAPRVTHDSGAAGLIGAMSGALGERAPAWLSLLAEESGARAGGARRATFAMYCFWSGEGHLGALEGVVGTQTGFLGGHEVVEVEYDPARLPLKALIEHAARGDAADQVYVHERGELAQARALVGERAQHSAQHLRPSEKDDRYQLRHTAWRFVPMTPAQASRANADLSQRRDPSRWFSARQRAIHQAAQAQPAAGWPEGLGRPGTLERDFAAAEALAAKHLK